MLPINKIYSPIICTDQQRVMQVLLGLQSNALKFTEKGKVEINIKIIEQFHEDYLQISVIDTGVGIEIEDQHKLFTLFGFVKDKKKLNTKGIGLGLVISDQIVNQFDGKITFSSTPKQGSKFTFTIKLNKMNDINDLQPSTFKNGLN